MEADDDRGTTLQIQTDFLASCVSLPPPKQLRHLALPNTISVGSMYKHPLAATITPVLFLLCLVIPRAKSAITPLSPGPGDVCTSGRPCSFKWKGDATRTWKNVTLELMNGSNYNISLVMCVGSMLDGTSESAYDFTRPNVAPYQAFDNADVENLVWTARFTTASPTGVVAPAEYSRQPGGSTTAWGDGCLVEPSSLVKGSGLLSNSTHTHVGELGTRFECFTSHKLSQDAGTAATVEQKRDIGAAGSQGTSTLLSTGAIASFLPQTSSRPTQNSVSRGNRGSPDLNLYLFCALSAMWFLV
ncbi:hypothetical protein PAXINDRAFT_107762 [Paxillus involutus ATCC 200175]|nr:hypothetical protein PAXINDRAFT_107762 [Paxillus involutus ATCC 200175]